MSTPEDSTGDANAQPKSRRARATDSLAKRRRAIADTVLNRADTWEIVHRRRAWLGIPHDGLADEAAIFEWFHKEAQSRDEAWADDDREWSKAMNALKKAGIAWPAHW